MGVHGRPILTGIGSFPPRPGPAEQAMVDLVELQRAHGFGLFTDGEQRSDMLALYASLPGVQSNRGVPRIVGRIRPLEDPAAFVKVHDLDALRARFPDLQFKVTLTGPTTFLLATAASGAGPAYRGALDERLHDDLTEALRPIAHELAIRGAFLQVDDPILSQGMRDYAPALRRLDSVAAEVPRERATVHVCGGLVRSKVVPALLDRLESVSTLSLAFAGRSERENVTLLDSKSWEDADKTLGVGCIDVQVAPGGTVMSADAAADLLRSVRDRVGRERVRFVLPDCGLRATPPEAVPVLLDRLRTAYETVFPEET